MFTFDVAVILFRVTIVLMSLHNFFHLTEPKKAWRVQFNSFKLSHGPHSQIWKESLVCRCAQHVLYMRKVMALFHYFTVAFYACLEMVVMWSEALLIVNIKTVVSWSVMLCSLAPTRLTDTMRWRQHVHPNCWYTSTKLNGVTYWKTMIFKQ